MANNQLVDFQRIGDSLPIYLITNADSRSEPEKTRDLPESKDYRITSITCQLNSIKADKDAGGTAIKN